MFKLRKEVEYTEPHLRWLIKKSVEEEKYIMAYNYDKALRQILKNGKDIRDLDKGRG